MLKFWQHQVFNPFPEPLYCFPVQQFRNLGKQFMAIIDQGHPAKPCCHEIGRQGVQVIGYKQAGFFSKYQGKKQSQVVRGIKQGTPCKEHPETNVLVRSALKFRTARQAPSYAAYFKTVFGKQFSNPPQPLIRGKIVYYRYVGTRQNQICDSKDMKSDSLRNKSLLYLPA